MGIAQNVRPRIGWSSKRSISSSAISNRIQFFNVADMKMWATTLMIKDQSLFPWYDPHKKLKENWAVGRVSHPTAQLPLRASFFAHILHQLLPVADPGLWGWSRLISRGFWRQLVPQFSTEMPLLFQHHMTEPFACMQKIRTNLNQKSPMMW